MNPHGFEREDGLTPKFSGYIKWRQIKVTSPVKGLRLSVTSFEIKIFQLRPNEIGKSFLFDFL
jgi:hypothetical protein